VAGDGRVMSQPTLLSFHVLWLREHNRIASRLKTALQAALEGQDHHFSDQAKDEVLFQVSILFIVPQCGIPQIFPLLRFYVKSDLADLESQK